MTHISLNFVHREGEDAMERQIEDTRQEDANDLQSKREKMAIASSFGTSFTTSIGKVSQVQE